MLHQDASMPGTNRNPPSTMGAQPLRGSEQHFCLVWEGLNHPVCTETAPDDPAQKSALQGR